MKVKKIIQIILLSLLCWTYTGFKVEAETVSKDGLQVTVETDKSQYQTNDKAKVTVRVKNTNSYEVKNISVNSEVPKELLVCKDSELSFKIKQLKANESKKFVFSIYENKATKNPIESNDKNKTSKDDVKTGIDIPWLPLTGGFILSCGALLLLKKCKKKSLLLLLIATTMGLSSLNMKPVMAKTEKENFQVDINIKYGKENYKLKTKVSYDKQNGEINKVGEVTKEEWITTLVDTMGLSLKEKVDGYSFDDFDETKKADKIETAIQYQILDLKANKDNMILFEPNAFATREFVAYTTIRALGYIPTEEDLKINVSDKGTLLYPGEDNISLDLGMLSLISNRFMPNQYVIESEIQNVVNKVNEILNYSEIDKDHIDKVEFQEGVTETTLQFEIVKDENKVFVFDKSMVKNWKKDEVHILYSKDKSQKDTAIKISSIIEESDKTIITYTQPKPEEIAKSMDLEGIKKAEGTFTPAEDVVIEDVPQTRIETGGTIPLSGNKKFTISISDNLKVKGNINLKEIKYKVNANMSFKHGINIKDLYFSILNENTLSASWEQNQIKPVHKPIGKYSAHVGYGVNVSGTVYLNIDIEGKIELSFTNTNEVGVQYSHKRLRPVLNIDNRLTLEKAEGSLKVGIGPEIGCDWLSLDLLKFGMDLGSKFEVEVSDTYMNPYGICIDGRNYLYSSCFAQIGPESLDIKYEKDIYTSKNSPCRSKLHIEETGIKANCTRNSKGDYKGIVKDANSNQVIKKAKIQVLKGKTLLDTNYSGSDGNFVGLKLSKGEYSLRVSAKGYQPYEKKFKVIGGETTYLETQLMINNESSGISSICNGKITNAFTGENVSGATIKIFKQQLNSKGELVKEIRSDKNGKYKLNLLSGNYEFAVNKDGFIPISKDVTIRKTGNNIIITMNPENQGSIKAGDNYRIQSLGNATPGSYAGVMATEDSNISYYSESIKGGSSRTRYKEEIKKREEIWINELFDITVNSGNLQIIVENSSESEKKVNLSDLYSITPLGHEAVYGFTLTDSMNLTVENTAFFWADMDTNTTDISGRSLGNVDYNEVRTSYWWNKHMGWDIEVGESTYSEEANFWAPISDCTKRTYNVKKGTLYIYLWYGEKDKLLFY